MASFSVSRPLYATIQPACTYPPGLRSVQGGGSRSKNRLRGRRSAGVRDGPDVSTEEAFRSGARTNIKNAAAACDGGGKSVILGRPQGADARQGDG